MLHHNPLDAVVLGYIAVTPKSEVTGIRAETETPEYIEIKENIENTEKHVRGAPGNSNGGEEEDNWTQVVRRTKKLRFEETVPETH
jgi:hypothetical protein